MTLRRPAFGPFWIVSCLILSIFLTLALTLPAQADIDPEVAALVQFETRANAAGARSAEKVAIEHYEIPLKSLEKDIADRIPPNVRDSLIFEKNGEKHVRWIINPEDTKWHLEVEKWLKSKGLSTERHKHFNAYMTASRSYILEDPKNGAQFSAKVSTNQTGGAWRDKKQPIDDARQVRMAADYVREGVAEKPMLHSTIMDEPALFGIKELDQAMLVRTLDGLAEDNKVYLPGFSAVHDRVGAMIAKKNGSTNPAAFWNEHYNKPLGRALAEFTARFGLCFDSPHSQNFLVELDGNLKPTGKIIIRDFGDSYATQDFFAAKGRMDFIAKWEADNVIKGEIPMAIGVLHGNEMPSWIDNEEYMKWGREFFEEYEQELARLTGVPRAELKEQLYVSGRYFSKSYSAKSPAWNAYLKGLGSQADAPFAATAATQRSLLRALVNQADAKSNARAMMMVNKCMSNFGNMAK